MSRSDEISLEFIGKQDYMAKSVNISTEFLRTRQSEKGESDQLSAVRVVDLTNSA